MAKKPAKGKASSSKKKKKDSHDGGGSIDLLGEGRKGIELAKEAYPAFLGLEQQYGKDFARAEVDTATARARAEEEGIRTNGRSFRDALLQASPEIAASSDAMQRELADTGPSAIETTLNQQAQDELALGGALSADEVRQATQGARAASQSRGMVHGLPAAVQEVLARTQMTEARKAGRRGFAGQVQALTDQRKAGDRAFIGNSFAQTAGFFDPQQRLYGKGGSVVTGQTTGPANYSPFLNAASGIAQANLDAQISREQMAMADEQFKEGMAWDKEAFGVNAADSRNNAAANNRAAKSAAKSQAVGAGVGMAAMAALMFL